MRGVRIDDIERRSRNPAEINVVVVAPELQKFDVMPAYTGYRQRSIT